MDYVNNLNKENIVLGNNINNNKNSKKDKEKLIRYGQTFNKFLYNCVKNNIVVSFLLFNNIKITGTVIGYDQYEITVKSNDKVYYIFKHAIISVTTK